MEASPSRNDFFVDAKSKMARAGIRTLALTKINLNAGLDGGATGVIFHALGDLSGYSARTRWWGAGPRGLAAVVGLARGSGAARPLLPSAGPVATALRRFDRRDYWDERLALSLRILESAPMGLAVHRVGVGASGLSACMILALVQQPTQHMVGLVSSRRSGSCIARGRLDFAQSIHCPSPALSRTFRRSAPSRTERSGTPDYMCSCVWPTGLSLVIREV